MQIIQEQRQAFFDFANRVLCVDHLSRDSGDKVIAVVADNGPIIAVVVFTNWTPTGCEISIASDRRRRWVSRCFLRTCAEYVFCQCGKQRVTGVIHDDNNDSVRLALKAGFTQEGRLKKWFKCPDGYKDGIVMGMLKEECKWLETQ